MGVEGNSLCLSGRTPVYKLISFAAGLDGVDGSVQKLFKDIIICLCSYGSFISTTAFEITHFTSISESGDTNPPIVDYIQSFSREGLSDGIIPSQSAFHYTCSNGYEDSVNLLVETNALPISGEILRDVSLSPNEQIRDAIIQTFVLRRRHLQALLERHLTEQEMTQLRIRPGSLPGYNSGKAQQLLKAKSINCVYPEDKSSWLIYDIFSDNSVLADQLWESGFRDVEEVDSKGWNSIHVNVTAH
ncbi:hypothetical protein N7493_002447 [Penicillium malachiteum]|uniref:Uncharacterized protein n=1 Tax=Penicillium malachiteum TaxID=1324776 RepID=A0AAD6MYQ0_9EURO|nr:hypothetical protein N7493_002447 [Penicillium malachiteum]